jgi:two-component system chemotaxis response regulator CheB
MTKLLRVLVVDDNEVIRALLSKIIDGTPGFQVVGTAVDAFDARDKIVKLNPDVMTLDIEMPKMDGVTFLRKVMAHYPVPTIIISSLSHSGSDAAIAAMNAGAFDAIPKPVLDRPGAIDAFRSELMTRIRGGLSRRHELSGVIERQHSAQRSEQQVQVPQRIIDYAILAIGASTGGTEAIRAVLESLQPPIPAILVVQHMPPLFTKVFAKNLDNALPFEVIEGQNGDSVKPGRVIIAPGDFHMELKGGNGKYTIALNQEPTVHGVRPAVDHLFKSLAHVGGKRVVAAVLTGMGRDGCDGASAIRSAGGWVVAQDEKTSIVFGMPKAVIDAGAADEIKPLALVGEAFRTKLFKMKV